MEVARENLREATVGHAAIGDGFYGLISGDSYDATRLVRVDSIAGLEGDGPHVAMVPYRDGLIVAGSEGEGGLAMLADLGKKGLAEPYALSGSPLMLEGGEWRDWLPPEGHPLRERFFEIRKSWLGPEYAA